MQAPSQPDTPALRRSPAFLLLFAVAWAGGTIAYLPLLSVLLPIRVEEMAADARIGLVAAIALAGAVAASLSNIFFGWLSDKWVARGGGRRAWAAAGLIATALSFIGVAIAPSPATLVAAIILFQIAVNMLLAPLIAIMADEVPDAQKGIAGGLMAFAPPAAAAVALLSVSLDGGAVRLAFVAAVMVASAAPLLFTTPRPVPIIPSATPPATARRELLASWSARLLVQLAGNVLMFYLLYYVASIDRAPAGELATDVSRLMLLGYLAPLPVAALLGRLSDRLHSRRPFLLGTAAIAGIGLTLMALATTAAAGATGFIVYAIGSQTFLALHNAFFMQLLPRPQHRGRDLGVLNLANTLPAILGPLLAWAIATPDDFAPLMLLLAGLTFLGGAMTFAVRSLR